MLFASLIAVAILTLIYALLHHKRQRPTLPYPPGPTVASMPADNAWVEYRNWGRVYGKLVYLQDRNILILNDSRAAIDLLEKRARIYSDRKMTPMMKLCAMPYSDNWRRKRKLFQQNFRQSTFLRNLITTPDKFMQHIMALSQRIMFSSLWGLDVHPEDPLAQNAVKGVLAMGQTAIPGAFPAIERFPWLRLMPSWFPGCEFARVAEQCLKTVKEANTIPFDMAMDNLKTGKGTSLIAELASKCEGDLTEIEAIKAMGTTSYLDTTASSIGSFTLTMVLHPDVQAKGQEEIDHMVGRDRLPTFEDRLSLPYIKAIYRIKHSSIEDDSYLGYHILKRCTVIPNIWAMNRDPDVYPRPDDFFPERFLDSPGPFTSLNNISVYGFGRRVCIGRYMADNTVWLTIASVLATLNLCKPKDKQGNDIAILEDYTSGFFRHPKPFQCSITPCTPYAEKLIIAMAS
ncbi:cytochrome P450 2 Le.CYP2 [Gymnopus androsaceus JB14]|uniref:Cytochrome P450 2 Le.CYP2 n=1 Tax=Gymnopus androsaceus JB14 TaxID=1447944 RepID=A0A6A4HJW5_9AGAR|nr:cytochrome P450 2 Le.CYP2 [Gymnopus androsaceus JB14]